MNTKYSFIKLSFPAIIVLVTLMTVLTLPSCRVKKNVSTDTALGNDKAPGSAGHDASKEIRSFEPLTQEEQIYLLTAARRSLEEYIQTGQMAEFDLPDPHLKHLYEKRGIFVTLKKNSELRGCTGCIHAQLRLFELVGQMAIASDFNDSRFPPLSGSELENIRIEISVYLSKVVPIDSVKEFVVGRHGIILQKGEYGSTFLPHVAGEQGWDRMTTLECLCMKAGLAPDAWKDKGTQFFIYETQVFHE